MKADATDIAGSEGHINSGLQDTNGNNSQYEHNNGNGVDKHPEDGEPKIHPNFYKLPSVLEIDFDAIEDKPWNAEGADISDYFNYGFDEELFKIYQSKVRDNFNNLDREALQADVNKNGLELEHKLVNFHLPHEAGGCSIARSQEYARVNTYRVGKFQSKFTHEI